MIVIYEEFRTLLPAETQDLILDSLRNNTIGDSYRVGGVDGDNLYPAYSNAWLMRTVVTSWTGQTLNDRNMTEAGNNDAQAFLDLFERNKTLSEFNGPTYAGVSIYALTIAAKYVKSTIGHRAGDLVQSIWEYEAELWNPNMRNFAGPWDRSYGYDMNQYVAIMSIWIWTLLGREHAFTTGPAWSLSHAGDFQIAPVIAALADFHKTLVPGRVVDRLTSFSEHTYTGQAYAPPADLEPRNITTWLSKDLAIGAFSFNQTTLGGFSEDPSSFSPAVVQWMRSDESIGYLSLYPAETALKADVAPNALNLTYPLGNASSTFTFVLAANPLGKKRDITSLDDVDGVDIKVGGSVDPTPEISFCGLLGGCEVIQ